MTKHFSFVRTVKSRFFLLLFFVVCGLTLLFASRSLYLYYHFKDSPNVLIITLDTTRADHLGCYGYADIKTPSIDSVAREGVLFDDAFSVQPVTLPAHFSIFTGDYPFRHGVRHNVLYRLEEKHHTLTEILSDEGYLTAAFVSSFILDSKFGLDQGFSLYDDNFLKPAKSGRVIASRRAEEVSLQSSKWLDANRKQLERRPFLLWLHYYDPHADYEPPSPYREEYSNAYDGEIAYMDEWIGYVLEKLKTMGLWDNTIVVVVSDHGESLGEHGEKTHGIFIYRSTTHVPLIIKYPNSLHGGQRIKHMVSIVDIMPTILGLLNINTEYECDGQSLVPLIEKKQWDSGRSVYSETFYPRLFNWSDIKGIRHGRYFFIDAPKPELYQDKDMHNLINEHPGKASDMRTSLEAMLTGTERVSSEHVTVDEEMAEKLKALGYFVTGSHEAMEDDSGTSRPDPKDRVRCFSLYLMASDMKKRGEYAAAVKIFETILKREPGNPAFIGEVAEIHIRLQQYKTAEEHLTRAIAMMDRDAGLHYLLGLCYEKWGKSDMALEAYEKAVKLDENYFLARFRMGLLYIRAGRFNEARQRFFEASRIKPQDATTLSNLGYLAIKMESDFREGIDLIRKALEIDPENPAILGCLGWAYYNTKKYKKSAECLEAALAIAPENKLFVNQLKAVYEALGDKAGAERLKKK